MISWLGEALRAVVVRTHGGPEGLEYVERPDPSPGARQILVRTTAIGVNFIDVYHRTGLYPKPTPFVLGQEGAGEVIAIGADVTEFAVGDRVVWTGILGSYAEQVVVPADAAVPVPEGIGLDTATALMLQGLTAHYLCVSTYPIQAGEYALVHAAAGGVGQLLTQLISVRGGQVIGTVSTKEKATQARNAGADHVINYTEVADLAQEVREIADGKGVHVAYDGVGATTFDASLASLRPRGMLVLFGAASGQVPPVDPMRLAQQGSVFLTRPTIGYYTATREELLWRANELFDMVKAGELRVEIGQRFSLADAGLAHQALESRRTTGKTLLIP